MARMVTNKDETCFLEIGIPTYNRSRQLERLLTILEQELRSVPDHISVRISISDNCSSDTTPSMLQRHSFSGSAVVRRNEQNIGALRNIWGLYESCQAQYIWIHSDDDIPQSGSVKKVIDALIDRQPSVLTFEFDQPMGAQIRRHGSKEGVELLSDMSQAIPNILVLGKLTKYVTEARNLKAVLANVSHVRDTGYGWQYVILEALQLSSHRTVAIIHEFLASCDEHFTKLLEEITPRYWDDYLILLDHDIVKSNCPEYVRKYKVGHFGYMVKMIYAVMAGLATTSNTAVFQEYGKKLPFHISYFKNPFVFLQWISLRLNLPSFLIICQMTEYPGRIKKFLSSGVGRLAR